MQKKIFLILFPCFWLVLSGCTEGLKNQIARLESEKQFYQTTLNEKQAQVNKLELEVSRLSLGNDALQTLLDKKQAEINRLEGKDGELKEADRQEKSRAGVEMTTPETEVLKKQIGELKAQRDAIRNEKMVLEEKLAKLRVVRIKVLTGDGSLASATQVAEIVKAMGYKVEKVDMAPAARFSRHTVFYAPDSRKDAENIVKRLGHNAVARPLSWPSVFNIIVVAGKAS
ncbi:MAG: LytR C-terminal domain-containing protein [Pseudomonadota bacterium]